MHLTSGTKTMKYFVQNCLVFKIKWILTNRRNTQINMTTLQKMLWKIFWIPNLFDKALKYVFPFKSTKNNVSHLRSLPRNESKFSGKFYNQMFSKFTITLWIGALDFYTFVGEIDEIKNKMFGIIIVCIKWCMRMKHMKIQTNGIKKKYWINMS